MRNCPEHRKIAVIYEDTWLLIVAKPAAVPIYNSRDGDRRGQSLMQILRDQLPGPLFPAHRLDRATSGLMLLARDAETAGLLGHLFCHRSIRKSYLALVRGFLPDSGRIDRPLPRHRTAGSDRASEHDLQECETDYRTLVRYELPIQSDRYPTSRLSLLSVHPRTGRWHQIRRHLNLIAHPILGDTSHGDNTQNRFFRARFGLNRLMLHSCGLHFCHPQTGVELNVLVETDDSFARLTDQLQPWVIFAESPPSGGSGLS